MITFVIAEFSKIHNFIKFQCIKIYLTKVTIITNRNKNEMKRNEGTKLLLKLYSIQILSKKFNLNLHIKCYKPL